MIDGKAMIDLRHLNKCDLDGECVEVCPTNVVELLIQPLDPPAPLTPDEEKEFAEPKRPAAETPPPAAA
jgi:ferredoxin